MAVAGAAVAPVRGRETLTGRVVHQLVRDLGHVPEVVE